MPSAAPITVAIPTCNGAAYVALTLRSILAQQGVDFELLVCDDRSEDATIAIARELAGDRARIEINTDRLGLAGNWNRCAALCQTPLLAIFHQDDVMLPGHLAAHVRAFASDDRIGLVASGSRVIDSNGLPVPPSAVDPGGLPGPDRVLDPGALAPFMTRGNPLRCSAVSLRTEAVRSTKGFDPSFRYVVDWEFWLRLSRTWRTAWIEAPTTHVRWHPASETTRLRQGAADLDETAALMHTLFCLDLAGTPGVRQSQKTARSRLAAAYLMRSRDAARSGEITLARDCFRKALRHSPGIACQIIMSPRTAARMAAIWLPRRIR